MTVAARTRQAVEASNSQTLGRTAKSAPDPVRHPKKCRVGALDPSLPAIAEVEAAIRRCAQQGGSILGLYKELKERVFPRWPKSAAFSYDALHHCITKHHGRTPRTARTANALMGESPDAATMGALVTVLDGVVSSGRWRITARDFIEIVRFDIEQDRRWRALVADLRTANKRAALNLQALRGLADAVARELTEDQRDGVRRRLRKKSGPGTRVALQAVGRWSRVRPRAESRLERELARQRRRGELLERVLIALASGQDVRSAVIGLGVGRRAKEVERVLAILSLVAGDAVLRRPNGSDNGNTDTDDCARRRTSVTE